MEDVFDNPTGWMARHIRSYMVAIFPTYAAYEKHAGRELPVVVVERR